MRVRAKIVAAAMIAAVLEVAPVAAGLAIPGTMTASVSPASVRFGSTTRVAGVLDTEAVCRPARDVGIEFRTGDASPWAPVTTTTTAAGGAFDAAVAVEEIGQLRAVAAPASRDSVDCEESVSDPIPIEVRAAVSASLSRSRLPAGGCARLTIGVVPPKPATIVTVERRTSTGWLDVTTKVLDDASTAVVSRCHGWSSIGRTWTLRATWAGDDHQAAAVSPRVALTVVKAGWMKRIDEAVAGHGMSLSVRDGGSYLYRWDDRRARVPASNEKLLLSMALLEALGPATRLPLRAAATSFQEGAVGNLWLLGDGDPGVRGATLRRLAGRLAEAGLKRVRGRVLGATTPFARDWFAPGWKRSFPREHVALPTALTFRGNEADGRHISDPERRAATAMTRILRERGIRVAGRPGAGSPPSGLLDVGSVASPTMETLLGQTNRVSSNFFAEVLGKRLGLNDFGVPGTISRGARGIEAWVAAQGFGVTANDASGLSYDNRISAAVLAKLLGVAEGQAWGGALRRSLASAGHGTLRDRLDGVRIRAKTATLTRISALSGYVWLERTGSWAEFSILSRGITKTTAVRIEDRVVRILNRSGR